MAGLDVSFVDLFSGAGGWTVGLHEAGLSHLASIDSDPEACRTASAHSPGSVYCASVLEPPDEFLALRPRVVVGSPPCQGFSTQGRKREHDPRNTLVWSFLDLIEHFKPDVWVFENVPGFASMYGGKFIAGVRERLQSMVEYSTSESLLDASEFGVPQRRLRFFLAGTRLSQAAPVPQPTHGEPSLFSSRIVRPISLWDAIADLPAVGIGERDGVFPYEQAPSSDFQQWVRAGSTQVTNHTTQKHSERVLEKIRQVPPGKNMGVFVGAYAENAVSYMGGYRRAVPDKPSYTAYWTRGMTSIHPFEDRFLSPRECARIQSFPDRVHFTEGSISNYRLVCNAVPPLLACAWGASIVNHLASV
jgi:DNA (cytosine-5)-methyltransferase 1